MTNAARAAHVATKVTVVPVGRGMHVQQSYMYRIVAIVCTLHKCTHTSARLLLLVGGDSIAWRSMQPPITCGVPIYTTTMNHE